MLPFINNVYKNLFYMTKNKPPICIGGLNYAQVKVKMIVHYFIYYFIKCIVVI